MSDTACWVGIVAMLMWASWFFGRETGWTRGYRAAVRMRSTDGTSKEGEKKGGG